MRAADTLRLSAWLVEHVSQWEGSRKRMLRDCPADLMSLLADVDRNRKALLAAEPLELTAPTCAACGRYITDDPHFDGVDPVHSECCSFCQTPALDLGGVS